MNENKNEASRYRRSLTPAQKKRQKRKRFLKRVKNYVLQNRLRVEIAAALVVLIVLLIIVIPFGTDDEVGNKAVVQVPVPTEDPGLNTAGEGDDVLSAGLSGISDIGSIRDLQEYVPANEAETDNAPAATENFDYEEAYVRAVQGEITGPAIVPKTDGINLAYLNRWPDAQEGGIPILSSAQNMTENVCCITVDDCFQAENLRKIIQLALDNNAKFTFFPIGSNLEKAEVASLIKWAWEEGMEIENHTYNHVGLFHYDDTRLANELWYQSCRVSTVLGVNYKQHFFRPRGGDERRDQRLQAYVNQLDRYAIANWSIAGSSCAKSDMIDKLAPGAIYLFHTTDNDLERLQALIPELAKRGYRMVTLNEMFGLPQNETSDLSTLNIDAVPSLKSFEIVIPTLKKTTYARASYIVQERLNELGWLSVEADGEFGQNSKLATGFFQLDSGIKADGIAGLETQQALFAEDAKKGSAERIEELKAQYSKK